MQAGNVDKHAPGWNGEGRTLCGIALEGSPTDDLPVPEIIESRQVVTCVDCRDIIDFCKRFKQYRLG